MTREEVAAAVAKLQPVGPLKSTTMFGASVQANPGSKFRVLGGAATLGQGQGVPYTVKVVDQNGTLKLDGFSFQVNGAIVGGGNVPTPGSGGGGGMTPTSTPTTSTSTTLKKTEP